MTEMDNLLGPLYGPHLAALQARHANLLEENGVEGLLIASGQAPGTFLDDHVLPFRVNPHFAHWLPLNQLPSSFLLIRPGEKPRLYYHQPRDYWHAVAPDPSGFWVDEFDIEPIADPNQISNLLGDTSNMAFIGEDAQQAQALGFSKVNPDELLDPLHFDRAVKSAYEIETMRLATERAVRGHLVARDAFEGGASEYDIHVQYLAATRQRESETPYSSIIALNEHCAVLHYQHYDDEAPTESRSLLIDAGASVHGYTADITRTYASGGGQFADLVERMDEEQRALMTEIQPGVTYTDLHLSMQHRIAGMLKDAGLVRSTTDAMVESNLTFHFMPHGLGHLLGLQTHDIGGQQVDRSGTQQPPPAEAPALRMTRTVETGQVFTIEPGLYFIPMLIEELQGHELAGDVDFDALANLVPFGGIRIEDNVVVGEAGASVQNLTRDAFEKLS